jgi:hypothetical protein
MSGGYYNFNGIILDISLQQAALEENMVKYLNQFLDNMRIHLDVVIWYCAFGMIPNVHSDAYYLSASKARSCAGGYFTLTVSHAMETQLNSTEPFISHAASSNYSVIYGFSLS